MATTSSPSQTLSRGIALLEHVTSAPTPPSIAEAAAHLGVHRSIAYRIVRTLEDHALIRRDDAGRLHGAPGLAVLARGVEQDLQSAALPALSTLSERLLMSAFVVVWDGHECITLVTVEPARGNLVTQRPGTRHPLGRGAPGIAAYLALPAEEEQRVQEQGLLADPRPDAIDEARERGWATSSDEVITGVSSVAVPLPLPGHPAAALAVVYASREADTADIGVRLRGAAAEVAARLGVALS